MTKTALENKRLENEKKIEEMKDETKRKEAKAQRAHEKSESKKGRSAQIAGDAMKSAANLMGGLVKAFSNHPEWYNRYVKNKDVFTNVPVFTRLGNLGNPFTFGTRVTSATKTAISGIAKIVYTSAVGPQVSRSLNTISMNPVNQILMRTKEQVLKLNSRSNVNWEAADLGLNIFASADILTSITELGRALRVWNTYYIDNSYYADTILTALGFTITSSNVAEWRVVYEKLRLRFNHSIVAPKALSIYSRKHFLASNLFVDDDGRIPQTYAFVHYNSDYWKLNSTGDALIDSSINASSPSTFYADVSAMITAIVENPDFIEMYQDLRHAVNDSDLFELPAIDMDGKVDLIYDKDELMQIKNLDTIMGTIGTSVTGFSLSGHTLFSCSNGYLYLGTAASVDGNGLYATGTVANTDFQNALGSISVAPRLLHRINETKFDNSDEVIENTRFMLACSYNVGASNQINEFIEGCGTEVALTIVNFFHSEGGTGYSTSISLTKLVTTTATWGLYFIDNVKFITEYNYAPDIRVFNVSNVTGVMPVHRVGQIETYSLLSPVNLTHLHDYCVLSELYLDVTSFKKY